MAGDGDHAGNRARAGSIIGTGSRCDPNSIIYKAQFPRKINVSFCLVVCFLFRIRVIEVLN